MRRFDLRIVMFVTVFALVAPYAGSTILIVKNLGELAREADAIVVGRVTGAESRWGNGQSIIWTHHSMRVEETWKGDLTGEIVVSEIGGTVGTKSQFLCGAPSYRAGDHVLLFLKRDAGGLLRTYGWLQGRFDLAADSAHLGAWLVTPSFRHVIDGFVPASEVRDGGSVDLDRFRNQVIDLVHSPARRGEGR